METRPSSPGLLFGSFLFRQDLHTHDELKDFWEKQFGKCFSLIPQTNPLNTYYAKEMGENLSRIFCLSSQPFPREYLLSTKLQSLGWEKNWSQDGSRRVNADIGFLCLENFILATTKNYSHRIFLGQDIFADLTYYFHQGGIQTLPWTYPDYVDQEKKDFFSWGRSFLLQNKSADL